MIRLNRYTLVVTSVTLALITVVGCGAPSTEMATTVEPAAPASPVVGVWQLSAVAGPDGAALPVHPQVIMVTPGYFGVVGFTAPEMPAQAAMAFQPTAAESQAILTSLVAGTGSYTLSGSDLTIRFNTGAMPSMIGGTVTLQVEPMGDTMTVRVASVSDVNGASPPNMMANTMTFRRLE